MAVKNYQVCRVLLWWAIPTTTWATSITLGNTLNDVPTLAWTMVFILSFVWGLAALLAEWKSNDPPNPWLFAIAHMVGSMVAGVSAFFIGENMDAPDLAEALFIGIAAYAGARTLDTLSNLLLKRFEKHE